MPLSTTAPAVPTSPAPAEPDRHDTVHRPSLHPADTGAEARFLTSFFSELSGIRSASSTRAAKPPE